MVSKHPILGVDITNASKEEILSFCKDALEKSKYTLRIVTPNPEQIVFACKHPFFKELLNSADIALPDGVGLGFADSQLSRIPGVEFMEDLCQMAAGKEWSVACIGGRNGVAKKALSILMKKYRGLSGWADDGPIVKVASDQLSIDQGVMKEFAKKIQKEGNEIVFIGLGAPKQELFMDALQKQSPHFSKSVIFMVVGGSFDMISGKVKRAPKFVQTIGFEWLWRLFQEPWRWQRQIALLKFIFLVITKNIQTFIFQVPQ